MHFDRLAHPADYWRFSRRFAKLLQLIRLTQDIPYEDGTVGPEAREVIHRLFQLKEARQEAIGRLLEPYAHVHENCRGQCCRQAAERYFTVLDHWFSLAVTGKKVAFSAGRRRAWYKTDLLRIQFLFASDGSKKNPALKRMGCSHLGSEGCRLAFAARPVKCSVSSCWNLRRRMDRQTRRRFYRLSKDIYLLCVALFDALKKEAHLRPSYGRLSMILTI